MESTFVAPEAIQADTGQQQQWIADQRPDDPQFEIPEHWADQIPVEEIEEPQENPDPYAGFDPQIAADIEGLEHLGYLEDSFSFCGHNFVIRTLHGDEELAAGLVVQPYRGSLVEPKAWIWAQVGMALKSVDRNVDFCPSIGPDVNDFAQGRFNYCTTGWFYPLAEYIYFQHYVPLQERQVNAFKALQSKSRRNRSLSSPTSDFSNESGITVGLPV